MPSLIKNSIFNFLFTGISILFPFLVIPYVSRILTPSQLGNILYLDAFVQYFILFSALGIPYYGVKIVAENKSNPIGLSKVVIELIIIQFFSSIFCITCLSIYLYLYKSTQYNLILILLGSLNILCNSFLIEWFYQGIQNFKYVTVRNFVLKTFGLIAIFLFVYENDDSIKYYTILTLIVIISSIVNFVYFLKNHYRKNLFYNPTLHIKKILIFFGINFAIGIYSIVDTIILGIYSGMSNIAYYTVVYKFVKVFGVVINSFGIVLISHTAGILKTFSPAEASINLQNSFNVIITFSIPFVLLCQLFPVELLNMIGGKDYIGSIFVLKILSIVPLIIGICNVFGTQFLMLINKEKYILKATFLGLITSLILNFILVPKYLEIGTAVSTVLTELVVCLILTIFSLKLLKSMNVIDIKYCIYITICCLTTFLFWFVLKKAILGYYLMMSIILFFICIFFILQIFLFKFPFLTTIIKKVW